MAWKRRSAGFVSLEGLELLEELEFLESLEGLDLLESLEIGSLGKTIVGWPISVFRGERKMLATGSMALAIKWI